MVSELFDDNDIALSTCRTRFISGILETLSWPILDGSKTVCFECTVCLRWHSVTKRPIVRPMIQRLCRELCQTFERLGDADQIEVRVELRPLVNENTATVLETPSFNAW
jgi:hypothetical protein